MAHLFKLTLLASLVSVLVAPSVGAEIATDFVAGTDGSNSSVSSVPPSVANIPHVRDLKRPATNLKDWMAQVEAAIVQVTRVQLERTDTELSITLETAEGKLLQVDATKFCSEGNSLIADIPNAVLALPGATEFSADNPTGEIANVRVTQVNANTIRVNVAGKEALPKQEVTLKVGGLAYSLNPEGETPEEELVVTGDRNGYRVPNASTATKTDTPLRDVPQSIQVVPRQVLEDQQARNLAEAIRNVPGVAQGRNSSTRGNFDLPVIRGFEASNDFQRNGLRDPTYIYQGFDTAGIDRIEVLKGPASVLFGQGSLGGVINYVTKQPLSNPFYTVEASAGSFNFYRGAIDLSGPLTPSKTVLYRLNLAAQTTESFLDFYDEQKYFVAPVLSWQISDRTKITFAAEYQLRPKKFGQQGLPVAGTVLPNPNGKIPRERNISEPYSTSDVSALRVGYDLEHRFSDNWQLRSAFGFSLARRYKGDNVYALTLEDDQRTLDRGYSDGVNEDRVYNADTYVVGKFATGSIQHQLVTGLNFTRITSSTTNYDRQVASLDLFNPVYGNQPFGEVEFSGDESFSNALGIYVQDQVTLAENLKLLLGGRFDTLKQTSRDQVTIAEQSQSDDAFSPRVGLVYQPIQPLSLYASYSRSFSPNTGTDFGGNQFKPERGTSYEVGIKGDISDRLSATLAFYDVTRSNVLTTDPVNIDFSIQTGEQRSRGVELSLAGEILPGWNIIAGYAYTDATITEDNDLPVGNLLNGVPKHSFNIWTSYEIQTGILKGFGVGGGLFFVGDRQGDLANTFELPSYLRTDAAIFYRRDRFRAAVNFKNLFNVDYFDSAISRLNVYYGDPFVVQGTVSWQF